MYVEKGVQPQVVMPVPEQDRWPALVLTDLYGLGDPAVIDALKHLVFATGSPVHRQPGGFRCSVVYQVNPDPALLAHDVVAPGKPVLPGRSGIQRPRFQFPAVTELQ